MKSVKKVLLQVKDGKLKSSENTNEWNEVSLEEICSVNANDEDGTVGIHPKNSPFFTTYHFDDNIADMESFVSCLTGYYRLTVNWTTDLCEQYKIPSLATLKDSKCHGPIGGVFSFKKLESKGNLPGQFILRQCEDHFDTYYVDIVRKAKNIRYANPDKQCEVGEPETFKIVWKEDEYILYGYDDETLPRFSSLFELATSIAIETKRKHERIAPSESDKPTQLLLCAPIEPIPIAEVINDLSEVNSAEPRIIKLENLLFYESKYIKQIVF